MKDLYTDSQGHPLPGMTVVADNLPDYMQYLDLVRDCIELFSLEPLPPNVVETQHIFGTLYRRSYAYAAEDNRLHRKDEKSEKFDLTVRNASQAKQRERRSRKKQQLNLEHNSSEADADSQLPLGQDSDDSNEDESSPVDLLQVTEE